MRPRCPSASQERSGDPINTKYDYDLIEREYVTGDISYRKLAEKHGIDNHSLITTQAKKRQWARKREEYRTGVADKTVVYMADHEAARRAREMRVRDNAIDGIDDAITKMRADLQRTEQKLVNGEWTEVPLIILKPHDVVELIDRLQVLFNRPSSITEERNLGLSLSSGVTPDILRGIVEATRGLADTDGAASSPFPRVDRAREN